MNVNVTITDLKVSGILIIQGEVQMALDDYGLLQIHSRSNASWICGSKEACLLEQNNIISGFLYIAVNQENTSLFSKLNFFFTLHW